MKTVIIGERYSSSLTSGLKKLGYRVLLMPDNPFISPYLAGHTDLSLLYDKKGETLFAAPYLKYSRFIENISKFITNLYYLDIIQTEEYPNDVQMNVFLNEKYAILNSETISKDIADYLTNSHGYKPVNVRQGYAKCCTLSAGEGIITSDPGIFTATSKYSIPSLKITKGFISLPGFNYGFIGGSAITLDKNLIAFTGKLTNHPDRLIIEEFLSSYDIDTVYLTDDPVFDIGGGFLLED